MEGLYGKKEVVVVFGRVVSVKEFAEVLVSQDSSKAGEALFEDLGSVSDEEKTVGFVWIF